jgi:MFS family permease
MDRPVPAIRIVFLLLGAAIGTLFPFIAVILAARGFDPTTIGIVTAAAALGFAVAVPAWGHLGDVVVGRRRALMIGAFVASAALGLFGLPIPALAIGATYVVFTLGQSGTGPLSDALAMNALSRRGRGSYGDIRLLTSLSYAVVAIAAGFVFDRTGYGPAPFAGAVLFAALAVAAGFAPDTPRAVLPPPGPHRRGGSVRAAFAAAPRLPLVLAAVFLAFFGPIASFTFLPLRIQELGGSASDIALSSGLSAAVEVPSFLLAGWLVPRIGLRTLFTGSAVVYAVCLAAYGALGEPDPIIAVRIASGVGWAGVTLSSVVAMALLLPPSLQATGQALTATMTTGLGAMAAGLIGGIAYDSVGPRALFLGVALVSLAAVVVGWAVLPGGVRLRVATGVHGGSGPGDPGRSHGQVAGTDAAAGRAPPGTMSVDAGSEGA